MPTKLNVQGTEIAVRTVHNQDYISLTDMCNRFDGGSALIEQWLRNKDTLEFLAAWERLNNPSFNSLEFEGIRNEAGTNRYHISIKRWIELTNGIGLMATTGRYGGTFAHRDIAFELGTWLSPEFKLYLITEFQRLKLEESKRLSLEWNLNRTLSKINYRIHTQAIADHLIPPTISKKDAQVMYANEADLLNMALFGVTALRWKKLNPDKPGNMRDDATVEQLLVLANLENLNALFIAQGLTPADRLTKLNTIARQQMQAMLKNPSIKKLPGKTDEN